MNLPVKVSIKIREPKGVKIDSSQELPHDNALALYLWWAGGCKLDETPKQLLAACEREGT